MKKSNNNELPLKPHLFDGESAYRFLVAQADLGPRPPGTKSHQEVIELISDLTSPWVKTLKHQKFTTVFCKKKVRLTNIIAYIPGKQKGKTILIGSHFDTRWKADREKDPSLIKKPIVGANDGGSGTAVMIELARIFHSVPPVHNLILVFFDGEDLGGIGGHDYATGSRYYASHLSKNLKEALILDMIGGRDMHLNIDPNSFIFKRSIAINKTLFSIGREMEFAPFFDNKIISIYCDHWPFLEIGIPAVVLIDITYPWWHTHQDLPINCSCESLSAVGQVLESYLCLS